MSTVTPIPAQVALNATPTEVKSRFGAYEVSWSKVTNPSGNNLIAKVVNAVLAVIKNIAQHIYNAAVFVPNKVHSLLYPNAASNNTFEDDAMEIQQDSLFIDVYETDSEEVTGENEISSSALEDLPEPVVTGINYRSMVKAGVIGAAALVGAAGILALTSHFEVKLPEVVPYFGGNKIPGAEYSENLFGSAGAQIRSGYDYLASLVASANPEASSSGTPLDPAVKIEEQVLPVLTGGKVDGSGTPLDPEVKIEEQVLPVLTGGKVDGSGTSPDAESIG